MSQPVILLTHEMLAPLKLALDAKGWRVVTRWQPHDLADDVTALIHAGDAPLTTDYLAQMPKLGLIACISVGYNGVDVAGARSMGIEVTHAYGLNADDVADVGMGLILGAWRGLVAGDQRVRSGAWANDARERPRPSLTGRKLGIVGLGSIGEAVARRAEPFGLQIAWWGPREKPDAKWPRAASVLDLASDSDILMIACRADESNRRMISKEVIEALGPEGLLVNVARGMIVDEDALIAALKTGRLGGAGLDVFEEEPTPGERWADVPNTFLLPHVGGSTNGSIGRMVAMCLENVEAYLAGKPVLSPVRE